jgi:hypothetical protein
MLVTGLAFGTPDPSDTGAECERPTINHSLTNGDCCVSDIRPGVFPDQQCAFRHHSGHSQTGVSELQQQDSTGRY